MEENNKQQKKEYKKSLINRKYVREVLGTNVSPGYYDALEKKVKALVDEARNRAIANKRRTVFARDA